VQHLRHCEITVARVVDADLLEGGVSAGGRHLVQVVLRHSSGMMRSSAATSGSKRVHTADVCHHS